MSLQIHGNGNFELRFLSSVVNVRQVFGPMRTLFARVICALFFSILATKKSGCVKYADFFCGVLDLGFILV
jgi:hypothetical protein